jgi:hypothetical protein
MNDVAQGIRVLQVRDGLGLSEEQVLERARNIVTGLMGNYRIEALDRPRGVEGSSRQPALPGSEHRPPPHG